MDIMEKRIGIIYDLASKNPGLGKTAMMKYLFILQEVYNMPLGYEFEIYTYGPYSSEVMADIDMAQHKDVISVSTEFFSSGHMGYRINPKTLVQKQDSLATLYEDAINDLLEYFREKNARDLELSSTIIYLYNSASMNSWETNENSIAHDVHVIKPHFDLNIIRSEYKNLNKMAIFSKIKEKLHV